MKRMKVLFGQRRIMVLATLAILVLAAAALAASSASFTATSANPGNVFTAGQISLQNDSTLAAVGPMMPDGSWHPVGTVTITNNGDGDGALTMTTSGLDSPAGPNGGSLSDVLQLRVTRQSDSQVVYGPAAIDAVGSVAMGTITGGGNDTYLFEVMFPDGDTGVAGADNAYQQSSMTIGFDWEMVNL
jgi:hypothetical protein